MTTTTLPAIGSVVEAATPGGAERYVVRGHACPAGPCHHEGHDVLAVTPEDVELPFGTLCLRADSVTVVAAPVPLRELRRTRTERTRGGNVIEWYEHKPTGRICCVFVERVTSSPLRRLSADAKAIAARQLGAEAGRLLGPI